MTFPGTSVLSKRPFCRSIRFPRVWQWRVHGSDRLCRQRCARLPQHDRPAMSDNYVFPSGLISIAQPSDLAVRIGPAVATFSVAADDADESFVLGRPCRGQPRGLHQQCFRRRRTGSGQRALLPPHARPLTDCTSGAGFGRPGNGFRLVEHLELRPKPFPSSAQEKRDEARGERLGKINVAYASRPPAGSGQPRVTVLQGLQSPASEVVVRITPAIPPLAVGKRH